MNIYLIGMKACGKTTVGQALSRQLGRQWLDTDRLIELHHESEHGEAMCFSEIYQSRGEAVFREIEEQVITSIEHNGAVVSLGGSSVLNKRSLAFCRESGLIVYLNLSFSCWLDRIDNSVGVSDGIFQQGKRKYYDTRHACYANATSFKINVDKLTVQEVVSQLVADLGGN